MVHALRAHVRNGRLVLDEPIELPEGAVVDLVPVDDADNLDEVERNRLHDALTAARAEVDRGEGIAAAEVIRQLRSPRR